MAKLVPKMIMNAMTPERWQQIKHLFNSALERPLPQRSIFLSEACGDDLALRSEVESLLSSNNEAEEFIDAPAYEVAAELLDGNSSITTGRKLRSYQVMSVLGKGGMGEVYLAEDTRLGRRVALKLLPSSFTNDADRLRRFEREARAASALNHPNILTIYEIDSVDGRPFIATEYVEGETLRQRQKHSPLKVTEVLELGIQVASALAAAHQAGIVHRDIKPENVMLRSDGYAKVVDFGLAKLTETAKAASGASVSTMLLMDTDTGVVMGTTAYMSPEQARGLPIDARTDIWSLGVVLYELLSGRQPFKGDTPSDMIVAILDRDPAPLQTNTIVPSELDWIVRKALQKDREERYQTARELLGDLRRLKQQLDYAAQSERNIDSQAPSVSDAPAAYTEVLSPVSTGGHGATATQETIPAVSGAQVVSRPGSLRTIAVVAGLAALTMAAIVIGYKLWLARSAPVPFESMTITRLTNSGQVIDSILSPDGKYLVYALSDAGKQSLWIRQVSIANDTVIVPPAPGGIFGITFSHDGNDIYYTIKTLDKGTLYRIPALGGTAVKILEGCDGPVTFSPDGQQLALVRGSFPKQGESALIIANIDGSSERTLAVRRHPDQFAPIFFTGPSWSPDGKLIVASVSRIAAPARILAFSVADGTEADLTPKTALRFIARTQWLPDMSGLLVIAGDLPGTSQVWVVSYPALEARKITNDLSGYRAIGITSDGKKFSTVQTSGLVNIWVAPEGDAKRAVKLSTGNVGFFGSSGNSVAWALDGRLVFVSNESGNLDIWSMDADGGNRKQLTSNMGQNTSPDVSPDGRYILFSSNRDGRRNIWRMDITGNNPKRLTDGIGDGLPVVSVDSKWVFYSSVVEGKPTLWKIGIDGGTANQLTSTVAVGPTLSPDGKYVAYMFPVSPDPFAPPNRIAIMPVEGGEPIKVFEYPAIGTVAPTVHWSPDGKAIMYTANSNNVSNIWSQPIDGGTPKQLTDFKDSLITGFAWSRDGKNLVATRGVLTRDAVLISEGK
jgi:eukaryotic-like serine/threonine-protein kinase